MILGSPISKLLSLRMNVIRAQTQQNDPGFQTTEVQHETAMVTRCLYHRYPVRTSASHLIFQSLGYPFMYQEQYYVIYRMFCLSLCIVESVTG